MTGERSVDVAAASGTLHVALLGGFSVRVGSRAVPGSWRLRKSKTLVKLLALAGGHRAHRDVLAGVLWPGLDPAAAANNLHQALHAARRALASDRSRSADALCLRDDIVILWPDGDLIVDADVFAAAAQRALRSGSVEDYGAALKLYAGELLPEDRYADWAAPHRERLAALHEALTAGQARGLLERRRPEEAVALLEPLVADRPNDEPLHRVLMEALDQTGRRWDALDVYERLCRVLDEEYAAAPEAATLSLYRRILSGQSSAGPAAVSNLPAAVTSFIGRRREIAELLALTGRTRLLTLSGPGGAGKTRLAIEVARRLANAGTVPDGVWLVDLSGVRDGRLIPAAAAASLGLALTGARPTTAAVAEQLADRRMVVLLDNCEHLLGACAEFAMALLERCAGVAVLATSREPLRLPGEVVWRVPSLELPDLRLPADPARLARLESVQLFLERAGNASPAFRLDSATALPVARICLRLDGMPLALELAASRIAHLAAAELAARLDDALATLAGRIHGVPDRQATLAATLDWSHDLLADDERAVFRRLSVFAGGFALDAAEQVCAGGLSEPVAVVVARLVDKSLVTVETSGDRARFRLLEVIRQYAAGCLASSGELACHQRRHALWYASRAESEDPDLGGGVVGEPSSWFAVEGGNLRAALSTSLGEMPDRALVMAVAMWRSWMARGLHAEGLRWLAQALEACPRHRRCGPGRYSRPPCWRSGWAGRGVASPSAPRSRPSGAISAIPARWPRRFTSSRCSPGWRASGMTRSGSPARRPPRPAAWPACGLRTSTCGLCWSYSAVKLPRRRPCSTTRWVLWAGCHPTHRPSLRCAPWPGRLIPSMTCRFPSSRRQCWSAGGLARRRAAATSSPPRHRRPGWAEFRRGGGDA